MLWQTEWTSISARIFGLVEAGQLIGGVDEHSIARRALRPYTDDVFHTLEQFHHAYRAVLPGGAASRLNEFLASWQQHYSQPIGTEEKALLLLVRARLAVLASFRTEFTYHISDFSTVAKRLSERAFIHLQSCINADPSTKQRWREAFNDKETACEKLGAAHLLLHGIWAFKAHSDGPSGRTDLVLGETTQEVFNTGKVAEVADALVLTEWKRVSVPGELKRKHCEAYTQAKRYGQGVLAGIELANYRYLIMVSDDYLPMPENIDDAGITYHAVNIAVNPQNPSEEARRRPSRKPASRTAKRSKPNQG
jgi:hypothetical protein